jgi:hypothetical protein
MAMRLLHVFLQEQETGIKLRELTSVHWHFRKSIAEDPRRVAKDGSHRADQNNARKIGTTEALEQTLDCGTVVSLNCQGKQATTNAILAIESRTLSGPTSA